MRKLGVMVLAIVLVAGVLGCSGETEGAPEEKPAPTPALNRYVNDEFGYSVEYPEEWVREQMSQTETGLRGVECDYHQVQVNASPGMTIFGLFARELLPDAIEMATTRALMSRGAAGIEIAENEPGEGKWDWVVRFTCTHNESVLDGWYLLLETSSILYVLTVLEAAGTDCSGGVEVAESFQVLGSTGRPSIEGRIAAPTPETRPAS